MGHGTLPRSRNLLSHLDSQGFSIVFRNRLVRLHVAVVHRPLLGHALLVWSDPSVCVSVDVDLEPLVVAVVAEDHLAKNRRVRPYRNRKTRRVSEEVHIRKLGTSLETSCPQPGERLRERDRREADAIRERRVAHRRETRS